MTWLWDVASTFEQVSWKAQCRWSIARIWIWKSRQQLLTEHGTLTFPGKLQRSATWPIKVEYEVVMIESCVGQRRRERNKSRDQVWSVWRSPMKGVGEEEAKTVTMLPELILRNPLDQSVSDDASARPRNAFNLRLAPSLSLDFPSHSRAQVSPSFIPFRGCFALTWYDGDDQLEQD